MQARGRPKKIPGLDKPGDKSSCHLARQRESGKGVGSVAFLAMAAADRHAVRQSSTCSRPSSRRHAVAAGLDHVAAGLVAAGAGDADAVLGHFALAHAHVAPHTIMPFIMHAAAHAAGQHLEKPVRILLAARQRRPTKRSLRVTPHKSKDQLDRVKIK